MIQIPSVTITASLHSTTIQPLCFNRNQYQNPMKQENKWKFKPTKKQDFNDLLEKYQINKCKYQRLLRKSMESNSFKRALTDRKSKEQEEIKQEITSTKNCFEEGFEEKYNLNKNRVLKRVFGDGKCKGLSKATYVNQYQQNQLTRKVLCTQTTFDNKSLIEQKAQYSQNDSKQSISRFLNKSILSRQIQPDRLISKAKDSLETSRSIDSAQPSFCSKIASHNTSKYYQPGLIQSKQIKGPCNIIKSMSNYDQPQQTYNTKLQRDKRQITLKNQFQIQNQNQAQTQIQIQKQFKDLSLKHKQLQIKYHKQQKTKQILLNSLNFQRVSYSILLNHRNNQLECYNNQIEQLKTSKIQTEVLNREQQKQIMQCICIIQKLKIQISGKDKELAQIQSALQLQKSRCCQVVQQYQKQIKKIEQRLEQDINQRKTQEFSNKNQIATLSNLLKQSQNQLIIFKDKSIDLQQQLNLLTFYKIYPSHHTPDPSNNQKLAQTSNEILEQLQELYVKYKESKQQLNKCKNHISHYQCQGQKYQEMIEKMNLIIKYKEQEIQGGKKYQEEIGNRLRVIERLLEIANEDLIKKQLEIGDYKYEREEVVQKQLKEQNQKLRDLIKKVIDQAQMLQKRMELQRIFKNDGNNQENSNIKTIDEIVKKSKYYKRKRNQGLDIIEVL